MTEHDLIQQARQGDAEAIDRRLLLTERLGQQHAADADRLGGDLGRPCRRLGRAGALRALGRLDVALESYRAVLTIDEGTHLLDSAFVTFSVAAEGQEVDLDRVRLERHRFAIGQDAREREAALERRLANRLRQLKLATTPDGRVLGGPDRADGDPVEVNLNSAMYGPPDEIARKIEALRAAGAGYLLLNGGGSGGGERGRESLRRFAREVMPAFSAG